MGGRPKALLEWGGRTFLEIIAERARQGGVTGVAVVLGYYREEVEELATGICDVVAINEDPSRGMASSARALASALPRSSSLLLWPVDIPNVRASTIHSLVEWSRAHPGRVIVPRVAGQLGHPPLLPSCLVSQVCKMGDDQRLDRFIEAQGGPPLYVDIADVGIARDVDFPDELEEMTKDRPG